MVYGVWSKRVDGSLSLSGTETANPAGSRLRGRIIGTTVLVFLTAASALGEFVVQPILRRQQVAPGAHGVPLNFQLMNPGDVASQVALRFVDLAKDPNGVWTEADPNDPNGLALPSCRDWLTCPVTEVQLEPNQVYPIPIAADVPTDANGLHYAGLIVETLQKADDDSPYGGALVQLQYLAPIILDVQASASEASAAPSREIPTRTVDPNTAGHTLDLRVAPMRDEMEPIVLDECRRALVEERGSAKDLYLWISVRAGTNLRPGVITHEHRDKTWLLVRNRRLFRLVPVQDWHPACVDRVTYVDGRSMLTVGLETGTTVQVQEMMKNCRGEFLAQVLDGEVVLVLPIPRSGGIGRVGIAGNVTEQELDELAAALRNGLREPPVSPPSMPTPPTSPLAALENISGRVIDPNGRPVAGAQVALAGSGFDWPVLSNGVLKGEDVEYGPRTRIVETDAEGRFRFEGAGSHAFYVFAAHAAGFAGAIGRDFQKNREIRLEPWGRVEGQLARGCRGTDGRVWMTGLLRPVPLGNQCGFRCDTPCDADGRFVFEKVPAGWFNVGYLMAIGDGLETLTARTAVVVKAGETARVKVGGEGRPVIGRFVLPASYGRPARFGTGLCILYRSENIEHDANKISLPSEEQFRNDPYIGDLWIDDPRTDSCATSIKEGRREWYIPWQIRNNDGYIVDDSIWSDTDWRGYAFRVSPDGTFRIEDVTAGRYEMNVSLAEKRAGEDFLSPFAQYHGTIEVPPRAEALTDKPFDIGTLTLDVFGVGEPAPLFEGETADLEPVRLIDYRGKYVLLSFSANEYQVILDLLKELQGTYGGRGNFQVIGIGHSESAKDVNADLAANPIQFIVYGADCGGAGFGESLVERYHLFGCADMVLVDPQGKIAATHLWGPDGGARLMRTVRGALEQRDRAGTAVP